MGDLDILYVYLIGVMICIIGIMWVHAGNPDEEINVITWTGLSFGTALWPLTIVGVILIWLGFKLFAVFVKFRSKEINQSDIDKCQTCKWYNKNFQGTMQVADIANHQHVSGQFLQFLCLNPYSRVAYHKEAVGISSCICINNNYALYEEYVNNAGDDKAASTRAT